MSGICKFCGAHLERYKVCDTNGIPVKPELWKYRCLGCGVQFVDKEDTKRKWETPKTGNFGKSPWSLDGIIKEFQIRLDVCATNENHIPVPMWFTKDLDALQMKWFANFWMNCPYLYQMKWTKYAVNQVKTSKVTGVGLLRVDTGARYFQELVMETNPETGDPMPIPGVQVERRFILDRVYYWEDGKPAKQRPAFQSVIVIWSPQK